MLFDERSKSYSIMTKVQVTKYLTLKEEEDLYPEEQRPVLKTKSAKEIRERMIKDVKKGAVLPPIVLGAVISEEKMKSLKQENIESEIEEIISQKNISIIDGVQRTAALEKASDKEKICNEIRVELWLADSMDKLLYRMLILNTGQIPWSIKRQIEFVFRNQIDELENKIEDLNLFKKDGSSRRSQPGEFQASHFVSLFFNFGTRKTNVRISDHIAEEFAKLDLIKVSSGEGFTDDFIEIAKLLVKFDKKFSEAKNDDDLKTFNKGIRIFSRPSARTGFIVSCAREIMGRAGVEYKRSEKEKKLLKLKENLSNLLTEMNNLNEEELFEFLSLEILDEMYNGLKEGEENEFFLCAFKALIEDIDLVIENGFELCWRAY